VLNNINVIKKYKTGCLFQTTNKCEFTRILELKRKKIKKRDESMGRALWKEFYLNILSNLWCSSIILFKQLRWQGFYPLGKSSACSWGKTALRAWEKAMRTFERTSRCTMDGKDEKDYFFFIEGACDRFLSSDFPVLAQNRFTWMENRWESSLS